jgi:arylsulfatase A-like enzyme
VEPRVEDGYRFWQYSHAPRDDWETGHDYADWVRLKGKVLGELTESLDGVPAEYHQTTWCGEKTIDFIRENREGPWMASVNIYDPHEPFNPPKSYREQFDPNEMTEPLFRESDRVQQRELEMIDFQSSGRTPEELDIKNPIIPRTPRSAGEDVASEGARDARTLKAAYYAMIKQIDDQVGRILDALEETGQREQTLVIFTSDHGEMLGDHGLIRKGCRFYEGLVRVPLIFSFPGQFRSGERSEALVELTDIAPTLLELVGEPVPVRMQGKSLLRILTGEIPPKHHRDYVRCEYYDAVDMPDGTYATMYRDEQYKLVVYHGHNLGELYNLWADPDEFENLWDSSEHLELKLDLLHRSFDATMLVMDKGPERIGPM